MIPEPRGPLGAGLIAILAEEPPATLSAGPSEDVIDDGVQLALLAVRAALRRAGQRR